MLSCQPLLQALHSLCVAQPFLDANQVFNPLLLTGLQFNGSPDFLARRLRQTKLQQYRTQKMVCRSV